MTTTLATIHNRITCVLADVAPQAITERLAMLVWELDDLNFDISNAINDLYRSADRLKAAHEARQSLDFDARNLFRNQRTLSDRIADRETKMQLIMQLMGVLHTMTGTDPVALRSAVFGSAS